MFYGLGEDMQGHKSNENKAITIYDIAKEAGVSAATVSRVLTNSAGVRAEKRRKVMALVKKYDFKPNALAKGLSKTKSRMIGILAADIRNPYYAELFVACEQAASEAGYNVLLANTLGNARREEAVLQTFLSQRAEAIIQIGGSVDARFPDEKYVERINQIASNVPVVLAGKLAGTQCRSVCIDSRWTMEVLMDHLLSLGHRRIAMLGGRLDVLSTWEKCERYKEILEEHRIPFVPELMPGDGTYNEVGGYRLMNRIFDQGLEFSAVIAVNDFTAAGVMRSIVEHGFRIPEDISVVSHDNTYMAGVLMPRLTSIDYGYKEFGKTLVETAVEAIEGRQGERMKVIKARLAVRESSGAERIWKNYQM